MYDGTKQLILTLMTNCEMNNFLGCVSFEQSSVMQLPATNAPIVRLSDLIRGERVDRIETMHILSKVAHNICNLHKIEMLSGPIVASRILVNVGTGGVNIDHDLTVHKANYSQLTELMQLITRPPDSAYLTQTDVWYFCILAHDLLSGDIGLDNIRYSMSGTCNTPKSFINKFVTLVQRGMLIEPTERPTMSEISASLDKICPCERLTIEPVSIVESPICENLYNAISLCGCGLLAETEFAKLLLNSYLTRKLWNTDIDDLKMPLVERVALLLFVAHNCVTMNIAESRIKRNALNFVDFASKHGFGELLDKRSTDRMKRFEIILVQCNLRGNINNYSKLSTS